MSLIEHLKKGNANFEQDFHKVYVNAAKSLPYAVLKDAVLSNMKQNQQELKLAA